ncbi:MAG: hypothetical protein H7067_15390, partial [Burkholderiales bacterium]|nr:hypothetical protein [Opitutaceae bacterium]
MKVFLDLSAVEARPGRWAALLASGGANGNAGAGAPTSRAVELSRVLGYLAKEFSSARKFAVRRRQPVAAAGGTGQARYVLRPFASIRSPGPNHGRWLAWVCEYAESSRALVVVDREAVEAGALGAGEKIFSGEVVYEQGKLAAAYCDGEAVAFLRGLPAAASEAEAVGEPLTKWREYLDWRRKVAETKAGETYPYIDCDARDAKAVRFYLREPSGLEAADGLAAWAEKLRQRLREEELRVGANIQDTRAPQGVFRRIRMIDTATPGRSAVAVEVDFSGGGGREAPRVPVAGVL